MNREESDSGEMLQRAAAGDDQAVNELFARYRGRLRAMVRLRLNRRLQGRVDPSDVLQEAYLEVCKGFAEYARAPTLPFFLWLRHITGQKLITAHRQHLGAQVRDADREVSLYRGALPQASSMSLAAQLLGRLTAPSQASLRAELQIRVQEALNNVVRHASARNCIVRLEISSDLMLEITDDGAGLPPDRRAGVGLTSMRERAEELGRHRLVGRHDVGERAAVEQVRGGGDAPVPEPVAELPGRVEPQGAFLGLPQATGLLRAERQDRPRAL